MQHSNLAVVHGTLSADPRQRSLPSGSTLVQFDLTVRTDGSTTSVPISLFDHQLAAVEGDEVVVIGEVRRRFFRAGGAKQSRTEIVAGRVIPSSRRATVAKAVNRAIARLEHAGLIAG